MTYTELICIQNCSVAIICHSPLTICHSPLAICHSPLCVRIYLHLTLYKRMLLPINRATVNNLTVNNLTATLNEPSFFLLCNPHLHSKSLLNHCQNSLMIASHQRLSFQQYLVPSTQILKYCLPHHSHAASGLCPHQAP